MALALASTGSTGTFVAGFLVINVAVVGLFGGIIWYLVFTGRRSDRQRAGATNPTTISRLPRQPAPGIVAGGASAIVGTVAPGTAGRLRSPVTKTECVWYRVVLDRSSANLLALTGASTAGSYRQVREAVSDADFQISDDTGTVLVDPVDLEPNPEWLTDTRRTGRRPRPGELFLHAVNGVLTDGYVQKEFVIPLDTSVTIVGAMWAEPDRADRTRLRPGPGGERFVVSRKGPAEIAATGAKGSRYLARIVWALAAVGVAGLILGNALMVYAMHA